MTFRCDKCGREFEVLATERIVNPNEYDYDTLYNVSPCCNSGFIEL